MKILPVVLLILAATPAAAESRTRHISMQAARAQALAIVPHGRIRSAELERERGRLIYSFDIQVPHRSGVEEIQIDAIRGGLVSRHHESPSAERREESPPRPR